MTPHYQTIIIGAGVIGLSAAIAAQARGLQVVVVDKEGPAAGASAGNAGAFAFTDILPLASPGILRRAPRWLFDPLGPLTIPPAYALQISPWMYRFWRACQPKNVVKSTLAQTSLMTLSKSELHGFLAVTGTNAMLRKEGNLQVYEGDREFKSSVPGWRMRAEQGIEFQHLSREEMADLQPGLDDRFTHGTFTPEWYSIADPKLYTLALAEYFQMRGGKILRHEVTALEPSADHVTLHTHEGLDLSASHVVICAGAFSHKLTKSAGDILPLEAERGYNTTLPSDALDLRLQITFGGHGFVVTRLSTGIRVGGAVELGGVKLKPNFKRADAMLQKAKAFLPALKTEGGKQWMGLRPSLPDSLPAIGRSRYSSRVIYGFGHGHLGLTQSVGTARLIADLLTHQPPSIDLTPFSAQRF